MAIKRFSFSDGFRDWNLEAVEFANFNLLVGMSGVGKTRILSALQAVRYAATSNADAANGSKWEIELSIGDISYVWSAEVSLTTKNPLERFMNEDDEESTSSESVFLNERIVRENGNEIVVRDSNEFRFGTSLLPKLKTTESAINLLRDEETIAPIAKAIRKITFSIASNVNPGYDSILGYLPFEEKRLQSLKGKYKSVEDLREAVDLHVIVKAFILQENCKDEFERLKQDYQDIFPLVSDVTIGNVIELDPFDDSFPVYPAGWLTVGVKEAGIDGWITGRRLSSGMLRTLIHLIELTMVPPGTVVVIDEFENSLGVNCLPEVTQRLLARSKDVQFIITSHHPYIINNVPSSNWRLVTRKGNVVKVLSADHVSALQGTSAQDKFIRLINSREFEEGIQ